MARWATTVLARVSDVQLGSSISIGIVHSSTDSQSQDYGFGIDELIDENEFDEFFRGEQVR